MTEPSGGAPNNADGDDSDDQELTNWIAWLYEYVAGLHGLPGELAIDFCGAALEVVQSAFTENPPKARSRAALVVLGTTRVIAQVMTAAALDERITRHAAEAALHAALDGVRNDARSWAESGPLSEAEVEAAIQAWRTTMQQSKDAADEQIAADAAADAYAVEHPYGAILGYQDPTVEADIIFTQVCEFTAEENNRYSDAYDRLRRLVDQDLFSYVSDASDIFLNVVCGVLREVQDQTFSLSNMAESHERIRRIRSALIGFTSSLKIHQDQTYYQVKRKFGNESDEHKAVRKLFHGIYSGCFEYRWLIELRHVMLHLNMDAFTVNLTARMHDEATIELGMSRYWMAKSSGIMEKAYKRTELEGMTSDPSVLDMITQLPSEFGKLQDAIDAIMFPASEVAADTATVRELIGRFSGRHGMYALQTGPGFTWTYRHPSFSQLDPRVLAFADHYEQPD
ncbi:hypothetical protein [Mycolicibacterium aubagnense]|nr:hypothetical protein [Mycolicibacterium aubagnense]TLH64900.1 hypothetical protein C1S80_11360 [Mycolicibacterium aubagnense]WGI30913.1 hypothetical protein QDT91_16685 [Mycolicibacterium aubagnense]